MKIAINGIGVAGPALAWWLKEHGFEPVLFEKSSKLRRGGYVVDFWGSGYDVVEKMGLIDRLKKKSYKMKSLDVLNKEGKKVSGMDVTMLEEILEGRFFSIARDDVSKTLFEACKGIESHFGTWITGIAESDDGVDVEKSDGTSEKFDLVIGADGLHSKVRRLHFGPSENYEKNVGYDVAAFRLDDYEPREEGTYVMYTVPGKQVGRFSLRNNQTLFLFTWTDKLTGNFPKNEIEEKEKLREVFGDLDWEVPNILSRMDEVEDIYFDVVSQVHMDKWTKGRVALVGDAAACISLLGGEGVGLAILESYILAGELKKSGGNYVVAFDEYEKKLQGLLKKKQKNALKFAEVFVPKSKFQIFLRNLGLKIASNRFLSKFTLVDMIKKDIDIPDY